MGKTVRFGAKYSANKKKPKNISDKEAWLNEKTSHNKHEYYEKVTHNQHDRANTSKVNMHSHFDKKHIWPIRPEKRKGPKV